VSENFSPEERALIRGEELPAEKLEYLRGWYPVVVRDDKLWWRFFGDKKFSEPFFHDTVSRLAQDKRFCVQTSFDALETLDDALAPDAFIFHISRCGSTLLSQLLASLPSCVVMSEPPAIDSFLRHHHAQPAQSGAKNTLIKIVSALGQKRFAEERHFFVKLDSWHIGSLPLFREAFPATPFIFMYREPGAVLASHRRTRGRQMVPGLVNAAMPTFDPAPHSPGDLDGYCLSVLEHFFSEALRHADELIFVNYSQLPAIVWSDMVDFFSLAPTREEIELMKQRAGSHSKTGEKFSVDPQPCPCEQCDPYYGKLEKLRLDQAFFRLG